MAIDQTHGEANPDRLSAIFVQYREACPAPESRPDFLPRLWQEIEARQSFGRKLALFARGVVGTAAASCAIMLFLLLQPAHQTGFYDASYVEVLASSQASSDLPGEVVDISR